MTTRRRVLDRLVDRTRGAGGPVAVADLAASLGVAEASVRSHLRALEGTALVAFEDDDRVRATVTARELLALDAGDGDLLVVDPGPDPGPGESTDDGSDAEGD